MPLPLEAVPNVSEGRDPVTIDALATAFSRGVELLDVHTDGDHNRSVFTLVGEDEALVEALVAGIACAVERVDLRRHEGVHPRIGAADVVPLVPLRPEDMPRARASALRVAERVGAELGLPVFLYGEVGGGRRPAELRRGGPVELEARLDRGELRPDRGPGRLHASAGGVIVGARGPLVAFNVNLRGADIETARAIAALVREAGGGYPGVRALGLELPALGLVQVSMNVERPDAVGLHELVARIEREALARGAEVAGSELVGLMPAAAALAAAGTALRLIDLGPAHVLELRLAGATLGG